MRRLDTFRVELRKDRGIYIIMYINSGIYLQDLQAGLCVKGGVFTGGYEQDLLDTEIDLGILPLLRGVKRKVALSSSLHSTGRAGEGATQGGRR
jgi:hypothetical protein